MNDYEAHPITIDPPWQLSRSITVDPYPGVIYTDGRTAYRFTDDYTGGHWNMTPTQRGIAILRLRAFADALETDTETDGNPR